MVVFSGAIGCRRFRELPDLDVDATPLPRNADGILYIFSPRFRTYIWRWSAGRSAELATRGCHHRRCQRHLFG